MFKKVVDEYDAKHPEVDVKIVGGINDDKIVAACASGNGPDVVGSSFVERRELLPLWRLDRPAPYLKRTTSTSTSSRRRRGTTRSTRASVARCRCSQTDRALLQQGALQEGRHRRPPKTISELDSRREEADVRNKDGSLKVVGFDPFIGFYRELRIGSGPRFGANSRLERKVEPRAGSGWAKLLALGEEPDRLYGYDKLVRFQAGLGHEFSPSNAFETGKFAMNLDGEWRVAFIDESTRSSSTALRRCRSTTRNPELYGSAKSTGRSSGSRRTEAPGQAWALVKYLTTNDHALANSRTGWGTSRRRRAR